MEEHLRKPVARCIPEYVTEVVVQEAIMQSTAQSGVIARRTYRLEMIMNRTSSSYAATLKRPPIALVLGAKTGRPNDKEKRRRRKSPLLCGFCVLQRGKEVEGASGRGWGPGSEAAGR